MRCPELLVIQRGQMPMRRVAQELRTTAFIGRHEHGVAALGRDLDWSAIVAHLLDQ